MGFPKLDVMPLERADSVLADDVEATNYPCVVSIAFHEHDRPSNLITPNRKVLKLKFHDVDAPSSDSPHKEDIKSIIEFANSNSDQSHILVHCFAGLRRSPAAAIIMNLCWMGTGNEEQAVDSVFDSITDRSIDPNPLMISLADAVFGCHGNLVEALADRRYRKLAMSKVGFW